VQLIQLTDSPSVIMILWPAVVSRFLDFGRRSRFLDFGCRSKLQLFGSGPQHTAGAQKLTPKLHRAPLPSLDSSLISWRARCRHHYGVAVKPSTYTEQNIGASPATGSPGVIMIVWPAKVTPVRPDSYADSAAKIRRWVMAIGLAVFKFG
jgi:hypothetical protein